MKTFEPRWDRQTSIRRKGNFESDRQSFVVGANDQILTSAGYKPIILAYRHGAPIRLQDVADVVDDVENSSQAAWSNETEAVIVNVQRQPGANTIQVADRIKTLLPQLKASLPPSVQVSILSDRTETIRASVSDIQFEMMLTIGLVVMVMFLFLRNISATIIPSIAVPLSLVGAFGIMYLIGFSLNNLTLMALTISTGFVVDDAIVMIENITRYIENGDSPFEAALKGSEQIGFTILSLTVSLIAVLIPLLFMGDIIGRLFREFAITLSVTILVSAFVSLTLTPMMCSRLSEASQTQRTECVVSRIGERIRSHCRGIWFDTAMGAEASDADALRHRRHARRHSPSLRCGTQGVFPGSGYRRNPRSLGGRAKHFIQRNG